MQEFGFSDVVGHVSFEKSQGGVKPFSKKLQAAMDLEARQMIAGAYKRTGWQLLPQTLNDLFPLQRNAWWSTRTSWRALPSFCSRKRHSTMPMWRLC